MKTRCMASVAGLALASMAAGETITVCAEGCEYTDIQTAINFASDGDVIEIAAGTYYLDATINTLGKALTLRGAIDKEDKLLTVLNGSGQRRHFVFNSGETSATILEQLFLYNGRENEGGGSVRCSESSGPTFLRCTFYDSEGQTSGSGRGGAIYANNSSISLIDCHFESNVCARGGAVALDGASGNPTISGCSFISNFASSYAGGAISVASYSNMLIDNCVFIDNSCHPESGSAIEVQYPSDVVTLRNCSISGSENALAGTVNVLTDTPLLGDLDGGACCVGAACITTTEHDCIDDLNGTWHGPTSTCEDLSCSGGDSSCLADINGDGYVDGIDLAYVLARWGVCP